MKLIDMTGKRFGRLTVLRKDSAPRMWQCLCDCGTTKLVAGSNLRNGSIRSCGCIQHEWSVTLGSNPEFIAKRAAKTTRHGHKRRGNATPEYRTWLGMKRRCYDPSYKDYRNWGGRGIRVCDRWRDSFEAFLADMGPRPSDQHSIDRIDPTDHYRPDNCRWATLQEQGGEHKRSNIKTAVAGRVFDSRSAAARAHGIQPTVAHMRIRAGIEPTIAVTHKQRLKPRRTKESYLPRNKRPADS